MTQEDLGDDLEVSRDTVYRWKQDAVGYSEMTRLPGREPSGKLRTAYAMLLDDLRQSIS